MTEPSTDIRRLSTEEMLDVLFPLTQYAFHASPPFRDKEEWKDIVRLREGVTYLALFEDGRGVATVAGTAMTQHVRGAILNASGVWGVVTDPTARRKGYSRRLMGGLLASCHEAGQVFSCLYPFRESFYERLGYVTFPLPRTAKLKPSNLAPLLKQDLGGTVERVLIGEGYDTYRDYLFQIQRRVHGMAVFVHGNRAGVQRQSRSWLALARIEGELSGLLLYEIKGEEVTQLTLRAHRFYYDTSQARYLLLQWIAQHVDQASEAEIWLPPFEQPETWLADMAVRTESQVRAPMGRVVDVAAIGGMRTGPGAFAARVSDPLCPWNEAMWQFETEEGVLRVSHPAKAECDLTVHGLTALVYGTHDPGDFLFRGWGNPSTETQAAMRAIFPPMTPYLHEYF
ncbi:MAG: GNAT family N-acetyltransferase [Anaerolineae bacterium]|nr:GNAT family N-acetyltransferase [Anaerolineae bacterium]